MVVIPFRQFPSFTEEIILDDASYRFAFKFNDRGQYWTMTILNPSLEVLVAGLKIVLSYGLTTDLNKENLPKGDFMAAALDPQQQTIAQEDLGDSVQLVYITEDEIATVEAGGSLAAV